MLFTKEVNGRDGTIILEDSQLKSGKLTIVTGDSGSFLLVDGAQPLSLEDVSRAETVHRFIGGIQGLFFGGLGGAGLVSGIMGLSSDRSSRDEAAAWGVILGGMAGGTIGLMYGVINGSRDAYEFRKVK